MMKHNKPYQIHPAVRSVILAETFSQIVDNETRGGKTPEDSLAIATITVITNAQKWGWSCQFELLEYLISDKHGAKPKAFLTAARAFISQSETFAHFVEWFKNFVL